MKRVLLVGESGDDSNSIKDTINQAQRGITVEQVGQIPTTLSKAIQKDFCAVILNTKSLRKETVSLVREFRTLGLKTPVLIISDVESEEALLVTTHLGSTILLDRPVDPKNLIGITEKMACEGVVAQRLHRRHNTNESAALEICRTGTRVPMQLLNLSRGGAYFECAPGVQLAYDDLLRLNISLGKVGKNHNLFGKVVWVTPPIKKGTAEPQVGVGVSFVKDEEVYKRMLEY